MYETTQVTYGEGTITVTMSSESNTEVAAPDIRFGSYESAVRACFTAKELEEISSGQDAEVSFSFVMSDEIANESELAFFDQAIEEKSKEYGALHNGVFFDVNAEKYVGAEEPEELESFSEDVEMQYDIPLYLVAPEREYYLMTDVMGVCDFAQDTDVGADTLTVSTHSIGTTLLLYQTKSESLVPTEKKVQIKSQHLFLGGIVLLVLVWFLVDRRYKKNRE
ncbi:hypothetical protein D6855_04670 [Butyrivibrio sp. CB08]|uniref:hypothetical protein n=1 Tax=Butyrivibrio sp. CB08 TaxID=2364879 RepID=UPI000EA91428|nr:hypothetical protein [Butyrivibrio sp. CB08]RKM61193.1 hypothetical protein D6855_04670 [Butyrivibrio sp. CB08]